MPRNGSGTMTVVNSFSPGTTISSSQVNANNTDIADELTNSLALDGQSTMSGQLKAADGTDTAPGITFGGDLDTGFYRSGTNTFKAVVSSGTVVATFGTSGLDAPTLKQNGTAVAVLGANTFTADQTIQRNAAIPSLLLDRSDTHGDNVLVGSLEFRGRDSAGNNQAYAFVDGRAVLDDSGSETGGLEIRTGNAGSATTRFSVRTGVYTPNATGTDKGADTINTSNYYDDGVLLKPCVQDVISADSAVATGSTTTPVDDSIPQNTEGNEFLSVSITPKATANILIIDAVVYVAQSAGQNMVMALFQDSTANALAASISYNPANNTTRQMEVGYRMTAGTTSATTFKIRVGASSAATVTFNGASGARLLGGVMSSYIRVREFIP